MSQPATVKSSKSPWPPGEGMSTEEPSPYENSTTPQDSHAKSSAQGDIFFTTDGMGKDQDAQFDASGNGSQHETSREAPLSIPHDKNKDHPPSSIHQVRPDPRNTPQQWGIISFEEKFKPASGKHEYNDVHPLLTNCSMVDMGYFIFFGCVDCVYYNIGILYQCVSRSI